MMPGSSGFHAARHPSLRRLGLDGRVAVSLGAQMIHLVGANGSVVDLPVRTVTRMRVGYQTTRYSPRFFQMLVWTAGSTRPLKLTPLRGEENGFGQLARQLIAAVAADRGLGAVEGGLSWPAVLSDAGFLIFLIGLAVLYGGTLFGPAIPLVFQILIPGTFAACVLLGTAHLLYLEWPRALKEPAQAERYLPKTT